ncbi:MAG: hypothetical protein H7A49_15150 [Akkermansiaceae bacterium]|nr:hypothetical protein [Akkermansiaceae bacterium]MCP5549066.1 hypothetical protein [Akkermansiaceae bacterium]
MNRTQQIARLLEGWLDGGLQPDEQDALLDALDRDPELRRELAEQIATLGAMRAASEAQPRWLAVFDVLEDAEVDPAGSFEDTTMAAIATEERPPRPRRTVVWWAAAAAVVLAGLLFLAPWRKSTPPHVSADGPDLVVEPPVAVVLGSEGGRYPEVGRLLPPGSLTMQTGWLSIQTLHGVTITLDAPFDAELVSHDEISLHSGRARVHVPDGAEGFRLFGPDFEILDLGTEFATEIEADGTSRCRVFEGKADVSLLDSLRSPTTTRRVKASSSIRIDANLRSMRPVEENDADYPSIKLPPRPLLEIAPGYVTTVSELRPDCYWRFETTDSTRGVRNEFDETGPTLWLHGSASLVGEASGNHSGALDQRDHTGFFEGGANVRHLFSDDWTISLFVQFDWLQNYSLVSMLKYGPDLKGHPFLLQAYSSFGQSGLDGTGLHAVVRETPAWVGGTDVFANTLFRPRVWHHVAASRKGEELTLYLDGNKVGGARVSAAPLDFDYFYVGRMNANLQQPWIHARTLVGRVDEMAVFSRGLDDAEIARLAEPVTDR